jgi:hypothetical protein
MFAVIYLTWHTKDVIDHMIMAHYVSTYLYCTSDLPLVLGGKQRIEVTTCTDCIVSSSCCVMYCSYVIMYYKAVVGNFGD